MEHIFLAIDKFAEIVIIKDKILPDNANKLKILLLLIVTVNLGHYDFQAFKLSDITEFAPTGV